MIQKLNYDISVIICCYNSSSRIVPTLEHLLLQKRSYVIKWELIIVDNNSTDNLESIVNKVWEQSNIPLSIVKESQPGLSFARMKGIETATSDLLIFCDDDNWLASNFIQKSFEIC